MQKINLKDLSRYKIGTPVIIGRQIHGCLTLGHITRFEFSLHEQKTYVVVKGNNEHFFAFDDLYYHTQGNLFVTKSMYSECKSDINGDYFIEFKGNYKND